MPHRLRHVALALLLALTALGLSAATPPQAQAQRLPDGVQVQPASAPLARFGTSLWLGCHIARRDSPREGVFFGETACATVIVTSDGVFAPPSIPGGQIINDVSRSPQPVAQRVETAGGTPRIVTVVDAGDIRVTQVDEQIPRTARVRTRVTLVNRGDKVRWAYIFRVGDCYSDGRDEGFGSLRAGAAAACVSSDEGDSVRFSALPDTLTAHGAWQGTYEDAWQRIADMVDREPGAHPGYNNTCRCRDEVDNAIGLQWLATLRPGAAEALTAEADVATPRRIGRISPDPQPPPGGKPFVALGDSFSSGEGAGTPGQHDGFGYYQGTNTLFNRCHRSPHAYPVLVVAAVGGDPARDLDFRACSGAKIAHVVGPNPAHREGAQIDALGADTAYVTITIGGNDVGFGTIIAHCFSPIPGRNCADDKRTQARRDLARLEGMGEGGLASLYLALSERVPSSARIAVLGYPDFIPSYRDSCALTKLINDRERQFLREGVRDLNRAVRRRAAWAGLTYVDVGEPYRSPVSPHRACGPREWVNGPIRVGTQESFHPNRLGHRAMASAVLATLGGDKRGAGRIP